MVVTIITLLIAILLPSLSAATESARRAVCASNQRQISMGITAYAASHATQMPVYEGWTTYLATGNDVGWGPFIDMRPLLTQLTGGKGQVYYCPSSKTVDYDGALGWNDTSNPTNNFRYISYSLFGIWRPVPSQVNSGWNVNQYSTTYSPKVFNVTAPPGGTTVLARLGNIVEPARQAVTTDAQHCGLGSTGYPYVGWPGYPNGWPVNAPNYRYYAFPHRDNQGNWTGHNASFFDGHAAWSNFNDMVDFDAGYDYGAKFFMWYYRTGSEQCPFYW